MTRRVNVSAHSILSLACVFAACGHRNQANVEPAQQVTAPVVETRQEQPAAGPARQSTSHVVFRPPGQPEVRVNVELARDWVRDPASAAYPYFRGRSPMESERGLMYRREMPENHGMLFLFRRTRHLTFWMMNTYLPLDIIFVTPERRVLGVAENATPQTTDAREVEGDSQYVVEVNAGFARAHGITAGTQVVFENVPASPANNPADDESEE